MLRGAHRGHRKRTLKPIKHKTNLQKNRKLKGNENHKKIYITYVQPGIALQPKTMPTSSWNIYFQSCILKYNLKSVN